MDTDNLIAPAVILFLLGAIAFLARRDRAYVLALSELREKICETQLVGDTDELTGIWNRRGFMTQMSKLIKTRLSQHDEVGGFSLYILDLNEMKQVNDLEGHAAGDELLQRAAKFFDQEATDLAGFSARLGGDEFAIVLPHLWGIPGFDETGVQFRTQFEASLKTRGREDQLSFGCGSVNFRPYYQSMALPLDLSEEERRQLITKPELPNAESTFLRLEEYQSGAREMTREMAGPDVRDLITLILAAADARLVCDKDALRAQR